MAAEDDALRELCRKVAAGDADAQDAFNREVAPLVELIVRHTRSQRKSGAAGNCDSESALSQFFDLDEPPRHESERELARRICRSLIEKVRGGQLAANAETFARKRPWPTQQGPKPS
jgi:hypothetical protein